MPIRGENASGRAHSTVHGNRGASEEEGQIDGCIMPTLETKHRGIGLHWKGKESWIDILRLLREQSVWRSDYIRGKKTDLFAALSEEEENRDRIVSQLKGEKKWRNEGNEIPG